MDDTTAIALVDFACDGLLTGDHLEAYVAPSLPPGADRTDTQGEPDFSAPGRLLFGDKRANHGRHWRLHGD